MEIDDGALSIEFALCLLETDDVVAAVRDEVEQLLGDQWQDPKRDTRRWSVAGRPAWWWRMRLVEWALSRKALRTCDPQMLKAFRGFLNDLTDPGICSFVTSLLPTLEELADSA
jgi:hypothetical protein